MCVCVVWVCIAQLCIALNDMQRVNDELCSMLTWFDASPSHDQACDHGLASKGQSPDVEGQGPALAHQNRGSEDDEALLGLRESRKNRLCDRIKLLATESARMLEPHIQRLVHGFLGTPHGRTILEVKTCKEIVWWIGGVRVCCGVPRRCVDYCVALSTGDCAEEVCGH